MQFDEFIKSIEHESMPSNLNVYAQSLWQDGKGNWQTAHEIIQDVSDRKAAWIHAYLHRKEGDAGNAAYWYHKAGKSYPDFSLAEEWNTLVKSLL